VYITEVDYGGESPAAMAARLSLDKARAALVYTASGLVVAADTLVCLEGDVLGKPANAEGAVQMLRRLRDRPHTVFSGLTVITVESAEEHSELVATTVWMRDYCDEEIAAYVASGDPLDKAGAYAIQHPGFDPVSRIAGCYANVVGLPLCHLYRLLREIGAAPGRTPVAACDQFNRRKCGVASLMLGDD